MKKKSARRWLKRNKWNLAKARVNEVQNSSTRRASIAKRVLATRIAP